ncbi:hypothetical protein KO465_04650 [Candidatus Micrarchaeota archaeon]|jgi:hypothetical protein|nr:hypothetical protein [Candidatus Micrarchaeota archaeon]
MELERALDRALNGKDADFIAGPIKDMRALQVIYVCSATTASERLQCPGHIPRDDDTCTKAVEILDYQICTWSM